MVLEVPVSSKGIKYLLVIEDAITKWLGCYPMSNQTSETIMGILVEIFSRYGIQKFLHSDQRQNFESPLLKQTCSALGIETLYHKFFILSNHVRTRVSQNNIRNQQTRLPQNNRCNHISRKILKFVYFCLLYIFK